MGLGYLNLPDLTRQKFAVADGTRWYRTGDLGCVHPTTGALTLLGRADDQIKVKRV